MAVTRQAHRVALAAYSDAMASVLGEYSSTEVIRLDLSDFESQAVVTILRFLYSTELHLDCNTVGEVHHRVTVVFFVTFSFFLFYVFLLRSTP